MVFTLNKTSNQKNVREKKVYISAKDAITCNRKKFEIIAKTTFGLKKA